MMIQEGIQHITDLNGYDHLLLLLTLISPYALKDWKSWLLLVTLFTLGHSFSLFLSSSKILRFNSDWIELLIPITIFLTAIYHSIFNSSKKISKFEIIAILAIGLIHGFGFSGYFGMIARPNSYYSDLFQFNLGIEIGQIFIVICTLIFGFLVQKIPGVTQKYFSYTLNLIAIILSSQLIYEKWFF